MITYVTADTEEKSDSSEQVLRLSVTASKDATVLTIFAQSMSLIPKFKKSQHLYGRKHVLSAGIDTPARKSFGDDFLNLVYEDLCDRVEPCMTITKKAMAHMRDWLMDILESPWKYFDKNRPHEQMVLHDFSMRVQK